MYCIKCGQELEGRPKFCPYCGQQLTQVGRPQARRKAMSPPRWLVTSGLILLALILGSIVAAGGAYFWLGMHRQNQTARIVPPEASAFVSVSPTLRQLPRLRNAEGALDSGAIVAALPGVTDAAEAIQNNLPPDFDLDVRRDILPWMGREVSLAVVPQANAEPGLIVAALTRNRDASDAFLERIRSEMEGQGLRFREGTYRGRQITEITSPNSPPFAYATFDGMVVLASDAETLQASIDADEGGQHSSLFDREAFRDALKDLPGNRLGHAYLNWSTLMWPTRDEFEEATGLPLGSQAVQDVALAISLREGGVRFDFRTQFDTESLSVAESDWLSQSSNPQKVTRVAPGDSLVYVSGQNLPLALECFSGLGLDGIFEDIRYETGIDLREEVLNEIDGEYAWALAPDPGGLWGDETTPLGLLLFAEVDDRTRVQTSLEDIAGALTVDSGVYLQPEEIDGVPVWLLQDDYAETAIGYGFVDDFLFFGSSANMVRLAIEGSDSALSDSRLFQTASRHLPNGVRGSTYVDVEQGLMTLYRAMDEFEKEDFNEEVRPYVGSIRAVTMGTTPMDKRGVLKGTLFVCTE
jgi:hypothetical protein